MWIWLQSYKIFFKEVLIWQTLTRYSAHFPLKWIKMPCMSSAGIIFLHWTTASFCLLVPIAVRNDSLGIHFYLFWLTRKNAPIAQWSWQMLKRTQGVWNDVLTRIQQLWIPFSTFSLSHFSTFSLLTFNFFITTRPNTTEWEDEWIGKKEVIS